MNLEHLRTFCEIAKAGSFSEVAKKLAITQPAVSFQIQKLEHDLGIRLIDRGKRGIVVTAAGRRLLRFAEAVIRERARLVHDIDQLREEIAGDLTITASNIPGIFILPSVLSEFKALHPAVSVQVIVSDSGTVIDGVAAGAYEVGFCGLAPASPSLESFKIAEDEIVLITPPGHPFATRQDVPAPDLTGEPLIFREGNSGTRRTVEAQLARSGFDLSQCKPSLILSATEAVVSAVEAGAGIAFVSNLAIKKSLKLGQLKAVRVRGLSLRRDFFCVFRRKKTFPRLYGEFMAFVKAHTPLPS